jgi:glycolate oxidase iron-sulfur subunit
LLRQIPGLTLIEMAGSDRCCGSAGIYNLTQPGYARLALDEKVTAIRQTGADLVVAPNPGCMMQIASGLRARGLRVQARHLIDLLDQAYTAAETGAQTRPAS